MKMYRCTNPRCWFVTWLPHGRPIERCPACDCEMLALSQKGIQRHKA